MFRQLIVQNTPIFFLIALVLVGLLVWRMKPGQFRLLSWQAIGAGSALFWSVLAGLLMWFAWDFYYSNYAPSWDRIVGPLAALVLYFLVGLLLRWVALHLPGNPVVTFCVLGGLESVPEHAVAIYRFHILQIPLLQDTTAASIFIFAFFEYVVYWSLALCVAIIINRVLVAAQKRLGKAKGIL